MFRKNFSEEKKQSRVKNRRVHMSNERTFLAWIRTSIGIMAFGFVLENFNSLHWDPFDYLFSAYGIDYLCMNPREMGMNKIGL